MDQLTIHRLHFALTIIYHYIFPQLTMGLALLIFVLKTMAIRGDAVADRTAGFWIKIFGVTFVMGVVTGIPMEFQFGTNWSRFAQATGGIIGQVLALEGVFAFFLESSFLYLLLYEQRRLGPRGHWLVALLLFVGTWLSGFFIVSANAWMQHPVGYEIGPGGVIELTSLWAVLTNPWLIPQYLHTMVGTTITASFVVAGIGAYYILRHEHRLSGQKCVSVAVTVGVVATVLAAFPTGDMHAKLVAKHQPVTFAAMEGHFHTHETVGMILIGQPNVQQMRLDNPVVLPGVLSFLTHQRWNAKIVGLSQYDRDLWPDQIELLYYAYHVMAGLGTVFIAVMATSAYFLWRGTLYRRRWILWILMLCLPFPFIANTAGWMTAELGRQPWLIYGLMRTADGYSQHVSTGNALFSLLGFMGLYAMLSLLYFFVAVRIIARGPEATDGHRSSP